MQKSLNKLTQTANPGPTFVRPATPADAQQIGILTAHSMHETVVAAIEAPLSKESRTLFDSARFAESWQETLTAPLSAEHHVLLAIHDGKILGLAAAAPTQPFDFPAAHPAAAELPENRRAFEISNFDVDSRHYGENHEARMLAAITDIVGESGTELYIWVFPSSEKLIQFLSESGFAPLGFQRELQIDGRSVYQHLWWTTF
ncbi:hypothetical protein RQN30_02810 [Arcanobacterium hippocoleae]